MLNAGVSVHRDNGVWNTDGGYELPLVFATAALALAFTGPGIVSLDAAAGWPAAGWAAGLVAFALGLVAGLGVLATRETVTEETSAAEEREPVEARR